MTNEEKVRFTTRFVHYRTSRLFNPHSGAYLFIPLGDGKEIPISNDHFVRFQRGSLLNRFHRIDGIYSIEYRLTNVNGT